MVGEEREVYGDSFIANSVNWVNSQEVTSSFTAQVKIRYNHPGSEAVVSPKGRDEVQVEFKIPQKAITPGQAAVFYDGETVVGGGWIQEVSKS